MAYRILSLDGGGTWALLQVMALQRLYGTNARGHEVLKTFNLVAANSGGSVTLGALATDRSLDDLLQNFFLDGKQRALLFPHLRFSVRRRAVLNWVFRRIVGFGEKYSTRRKYIALTNLLGAEYANCRLADLPGVCGADGTLEFLIATFDYDHRRARFLRSNLLSFAGSDSPPDATLAEAIHASTTAPVNYFDLPAICEVSPSLEHARFWDGAIAGQNNPVLAAVAEALANGHDAADIQVLSLGTGTVQLPLLNEEERKHRKFDPALIDPGDDPDIVMDLEELASSIVDDPPDTATFIAHIILSRATPSEKGSLRPTKRVIRMSPVVRPLRDGDQWKPLPGLALDKRGNPLTGRPDKLYKADLAAFATLADLEIDAIKEADIKLIHRLGELWIEGKALNQPIRRTADFEYLTGHKHFQEALDAWCALSGFRPEGQRTN
jgi:uncharacterized protein